MSPRRTRQNSVKVSLYSNANYAYGMNFDSIRRRINNTAKADVIHDIRQKLLGASAGGRHTDALVQRIQPVPESETASTRPCTERPYTRYIFCCKLSSASRCHPNRSDFSCRMRDPAATRRNATLTKLTIVTRSSSREWFFHIITTG